MSVVGARPNFIKIAPFARALDDYNGVPQVPPMVFCHRLVHTGQHYDSDMSGRFFDALNIPEPDVNLGVGSGTQAEQVGRTMIALEKEMLAWKPDWVVVVGDVNATCAAAITARKACVRVAHIEAGLRSFDRTMPEEINRIVTDRLSDLLLTPDDIAVRQLRAEGVPERAIRSIGNIMIDTLDAQRPAAEQLHVSDIVQEHLISEAAPRGWPGGLADGSFAVLTMHRPSNVDDAAVLARLVDTLVTDVAATLPLLWTIHPRTEKQLKRFDLWERVVSCGRIALIRPVGYHEMLRLNIGAALMLSDSGGLQEECCVTGTPCLTLRENTERPIVPITFLMSLFKEDVGVYELHNNGAWYNFGFALGTIMSFSGGSGMAKQNQANDS